MKSVFILMIFLASSLCSAQVIKEERAELYAFTKVKFENHTYIIFSHRHHKEGSSVWHDIDCASCKEETDRALNAWKGEEE